MTGLITQFKPINPIRMGISLEQYRGPKTRHQCPRCGKFGKFTRYVDESGEYISDDVGRCDREIKCGYHKSPKDFFQISSGSWYHLNVKTKHVEPEKPVDYLPTDLMIQTLKGYEQNNLFLFLSGFIGEGNANNLMAKYNVGSSKYWQGATVFWQIDVGGRVRQLKIMLYNPLTGKRVKSDTPAMKLDYKTGKYQEDVGSKDKSLIYGKYIMGGRFNKLNLKQCFFGEHLLQNNGRIAIVESEKTAIIASHFFPELIWLATGGSNGAGFTNPSVCKVLKGRDIILFPDLGQFDKWTEKAREMKKATSCRVIVSNLLEVNVGDIERENGYDLADYLIANNTSQVNNIDSSSNLIPMMPDNLINHNGNWTPLEGFEGF